MENVNHFDGESFEADVLQAREPVVVDFYADWCPPCKLLEPIVTRLAAEYAGKVKIGKLNTDDNPDIAVRYGVTGIPTLGLFVGGTLVDRLVGYPGGAGPVREWINTNAGVQPA